MLGHSDQAAETEMEVPSRPLNAILAGALRVEAAAMRVTSLPVGSSVMCVARKRG